MSKSRIFDVDIDCSSKTERTSYGVRSMAYNIDTKRILPHPSGVHLDPVPVDPETGLCAIDHKEAATLGFIAVDILTNTSYDRFGSKDEVIRMAEKEPNWALLKKETFVSKLPHIGNHFDVVSIVEPKSIDDLADVLALIRPGKRHLLDSYVKNKNSVRRELYKRSANGHAYFKKAHSYSYAVMIVAVMNKMDLFQIM